MVIIYHNPRCRKSRETLALLEAENVPLDVRLYLEKPMDKEHLAKALAEFGEKMIRKAESDYKEFIKPHNLEGDALISVMLQHPKTIERPLVVCGDKLALGRPPETVLGIL